MRKIAVSCALLFLLHLSIAQTVDKSSNTIATIGNAKLVAMPDYYKAFIFIQEEEKRVNYQIIGKVPLDSVKTNLFIALKKMNILEQDLKILRLSSRDLGQQYPGSLSNILYVCQIKNKEQAQKLVSEMRFEGLKGILIQPQYSNLQNLQDSLYLSAAKDANRIANVLASKLNKTVDEVKSIQILNTQLPTTNEEYTDYNLLKFEMEFKDKYATSSVRVEYTLK